MRERRCWRSRLKGGARASSAARRGGPPTAWRSMSREPCGWLSARAEASRGSRPDGELDEIVELPASFVSSLSFGGADMRDVLITTADNEIDPELGGTLFRARSEVAGLTVAPVSRATPGQTRSCPTCQGEILPRDGVTMTGAAAREFFTAAAAVAGTLIGLLFVAISVSPDRVLGPDASEAHIVRAAAALTAFTNALAIALFGLVPGFSVGGTATIVSILGLLLHPGRGGARCSRFGARTRVRLGDLGFLVGLLAVFVVQLIAGLALDRSALDRGALQTICVLVIVCFLIGIARAWELVGGQRTGLSHMLMETLRTQRAPDGADDE